MPSRDANGARVTVSHRVGKYPYQRVKPVRHFTPGNPLQLKEYWVDAACPWSPWLFDKKDSKVQKTRTYVPNKERDNFRLDTKIRMRSVNYKRPQPLDPEFPEPELFCLRRRHFRVTRRNRSVRPYLERNPDMAPPDIPEEQPLDQDRFQIYCQ